MSEAEDKAAHYLAAYQDGKDAYGRGSDWGFKAEQSRATGLAFMAKAIEADTVQAVSQTGPYALESQVHTIIADLDRARANGTVYTYGNIQERLRNALRLAALSTQPAAGEVESKTSWDVRDAEPEGVNHVMDYTGDDEDGDSARWSRTTAGEWKGYKNGGKVYLSWDELMRRWGPVTSPTPELFPGTLAALDHLSIRPEVQ